MKDIDVLLIEDDADLREILTLLLEASGLSVDATGSGEEALKLLDALHPKMLVTDYNLSGELKGLELAKKVRVRLPNLPMIAISGSENINHLEAAGLFTLVVEKSQGYPDMLKTATDIAKGY